MEALEEGFFSEVGTPIPEELKLDEAKGLNRRYAAGVRSLLDRARLQSEVSSVMLHDVCSGDRYYYGDIDVFIQVVGGDPYPTEVVSRAAAFALEVVLHITVGGNVEPAKFSRGQIMVFSRNDPGEATLFELRANEGLGLWERVQRQLALLALTRHTSGWGISFGPSSEPVRG